MNSDNDFSAKPNEDGSHTISISAGIPRAAITADHQELELRRAEVSAARGKVNKPDLVNVFSLFDHFQPARNVTAPSLDDIPHLAN